MIKGFFVTFPSDRGLHIACGPDIACWVLLSTACANPYALRLVRVVPAAGFTTEAFVEAKFSYVLLGQTLVGAALYWWAGPLSHSMPFRLSAGSLGFMALSVLILIFVLSRSDTSSCLHGSCP